MRNKITNKNIIFLSPIFASDHLSLAKTRFLIVSSCMTSAHYSLKALYSEKSNSDREVSRSLQVYVVHWWKRHRAA